MSFENFKQEDSRVALSMDLKNEKKNKNMSEIKKGKFIFWKRKDQDTYSKSYVQDIIYTDQGNLLELADNTLWTAYPNRILENDIDILLEKTKP